MDFDPTTARTLPDRPGAMAAQPIRFKGTVTAGRPLPPRAGEAQPAVASQNTPQSAAAAAAPPALPSPAILAPRPAPARPDARPMRVAFGAGAIAAVGVLTVGLVQPDFSAPDEAAAGTSDVATATEEGGRTRVRRVTEYVFLKPGQRAPRGATVITADQLGAVATKKRRPRAETEPGRQTPAQQGPVADPKPQADPKPAPVTTRQSGS